MNFSQGDVIHLWRDCNVTLRRHVCAKTPIRGNITNFRTAVLFPIKLSLTSHTNSYVTLGPPILFVALNCRHSIRARAHHVIASYPINPELIQDLGIGEVWMRSFMSENCLQKSFKRESPEKKVAVRSKSMIWLVQFPSPQIGYKGK